MASALALVDGEVGDGGHILGLQRHIGPERQIAQAGQAGLSLPDRDYYLLQNPRQQKIRDEYVAHMRKMFQLAGDTPEKAASEAAPTAAYC